MYKLILKTFDIPLYKFYTPLLTNPKTHGIEGMKKFFKHKTTNYNRHKKI